MNEKFLKLYEYLKSEGITDLSSEDFYEAYKDPNKAKDVYNYVSSEEMTDLNENDFFSAYFGTEVKKKEVSEPTATVPQSDSVTPQEVQDTSSATTQPMATQESASSNGEVMLASQDYEITPRLIRSVYKKYDPEVDRDEIVPFVQEKFLGNQNAFIEWFDEKYKNKVKFKRNKEGAVDYLNKKFPPQKKQEVEGGTEVVEYEWKPVLDELGEQVYYTDKETGELKPAKEKVQKGFATQQEYENAKVETMKTMLL